MITGARAPVALHWAWAFRRAGRSVFLADSLRWPIGQGAAFSQGYLRHASPRHDLARFRRDLLDQCAAKGIGVIVPTCEEVFWLAQIAPDLKAAGVRLHAPPFALLAQVHDKGAFIDLCRGFWPHLPRTQRLQSRADLDSAGDPGGLVFKPAYSRFALRTLIRPTAQALSRICPSPGDPWVAQQFVPGREICAFAVAWQGQVTALAAYHPLYRAGKGAGIFFQPVDPAPALAFVRAFARATGWSGQLSFDLIETDTGLVPIECNPRATSGLHLLRDPVALVQALEGDAPGLVAQDGTPQAVHLAMWLYAAWANRSRWAAFQADLARADEALVWDGKPVTGLRQGLALAEIAARALWRRQGLQAAATHDIEWNG